MSETTFTTEQWQKTFKPQDISGRTKESTEKEADEFDVRLDRIIASAGKVAVREYQLRIQPALYQIDRTNAGIQNELVKNHCPEEIYQAFTESWDALKRLIWEIENGGEKCGTSTSTS